MAYSTFGQNAYWSCLGKMSLIPIQKGLMFKVSILHQLSQQLLSYIPFFATHGLPEQLVLDNGSGFTSPQLKEFMDRNRIKHSLISPYHPSSNGLAKRAVQTFKSMFSKLEGLSMLDWLDFSSHTEWYLRRQHLLTLNGEENLYKIGFIISRRFQDCQWHTAMVNYPQKTLQVQIRRQIVC